MYYYKSKLVSGLYLLQTSALALHSLQQ